MSFYSSAMHLSPFLRVLLNVRAEGAENLPETGPVVLCCNHRSNIDPVLVGASLNRPLFFMAKYELFKIPLFRTLIKTLGAFPVKRGAGDTEAIKAAFRVLKNGCVLAMFPEGTRKKEYGEPNRFKSGAALFASRRNAVIVPAAIICKKQVRFFNRKKIVIGKPIYPQDLDFGSGSTEDLRKVSEQIRQAVISLMAEQK